MLRVHKPSSTGIAAIMLLGVAVFAYACTSTSGSPIAAEPAAQALPVLELQPTDVTTYEEYTASLEGSRDIEIRAQVDGYLEKIFIDEGQLVKKGQPLFLINDRPYRERHNNAKASLAAAKANYANAQINVSKLAPLVENNVVSDVQLKAAQASLDAAAASVSQAEAMVANASIDLGFTLIKAPADGYVGRIPLKTGSLAGTNVLTVLSEVNEVFAYFSMTEHDFLKFENEFNGNTIESKLKNFPEVELVLADNSIYPAKGKVETISGQFSNTTGAISFRAVFENKSGLLRSGNTGKIRVPRKHSSTVVVPQDATFELQDKVFVFTVNDSNIVSSRPINVDGRTGNYYLVNSGLAAGTKIVFSGIDRLRDGMPIRPEPLGMDSVLRAKPL